MRKFAQSCDGLFSVRSRSSFPEILYEGLKTNLAIRLAG
jgi:hypothetical protein